jgi:hypothetical protein
LITQPVYIDDIIGEVVTSTANAIVNPTSTVLQQKTLLQTIQTNEATALGKTFIQQIRYSKSSFDELIETLSQLDKSGVERYNKYPLIHLVQDMTIERGQDPGLYGTANLNIIFIHQTVKEYKIDDRDEKVFKPVLWPIYYMFMEQLKLNKWIMGDFDSTGEFRHRLIKRAFWGNRNLQGSKLILNDFVDALEVQNLSVKINYSNC